MNVYMHRLAVGTGAAGLLVLATLGGMPSSVAAGPPTVACGQVITTSRV